MIEVIDEVESEKKTVFRTGPPPGRGILRAMDGAGAGVAQTESSEPCKKGPIDACVLGCRRPSGNHYRVMDGCLLPRSGAAGDSHVVFALGPLLGLLAASMCVMDTPPDCPDLTHLGGGDLSWPPRARTWYNVPV